MTYALIVPLLLLASAVVAQQSKAGSVRIAVALVGADLAVKPVPLHGLLFSRQTGADTLRGKTRLDGTMEQELPVGQWLIQSEQAVEFAGQRFHWELLLTVAAAQKQSIELTNANAIVDSVPTPSSVATASRAVGPEQALFQQFRGGVFRIESGLGHGSGFLVDSAGLILTNAHVVGGNGSAAVVLDSATHVTALILYRDDNVDLAVLRIAPSLAASRPVLHMANRDGAALVDPGERLIALGYPLHQEQTMTAGIASSIREGAIISDVNINHGNSGGPLLNLAGEVVGVNAFGDFTTQGGPGISGAIVINRAHAVLEAARAAMSSFAEPGEQPLPVIPTVGFRLETLKAIADSARIDRYRPLWEIDADRFSVSLATPPINYVRAKALENEVGKDRKKREEKSGVASDERYSELRDFRDWAEYVGDERAPVVTVTVEPRVGETGGSLFRRLLVTGAYGKRTIRYRGDLREAEVYRNGEKVLPVKGGTTPVKQYVDNVWVDMKDVANYGYYVFPAEVFAPSEDGAPPYITIRLVDLKNPKDPSCVTLDADAVVVTWNDFGPFYQEQGKPFVVASRKVRQRTVPPLPVDCPVQ